MNGQIIEDDEGRLKLKAAYERKLFSTAQKQ